MATKVDKMASYIVNRRYEDVWVNVQISKAQHRAHSLAMLGGGGILDLVPEVRRSSPRETKNLPPES
ncbi:hypothetical protein RRG08_013975 [Elysia crispata]|uniref:Uncharacterized protein n=1 Tax=Elysia crispata TaxID=231223 RepID=A0AAE1DA90_9GAST|nr:hypothetical protein RRG08_013975 [Elysia crispata]